MSYRRRLTVSLALLVSMLPGACKRHDARVLTVMAAPSLVAKLSPVVAAFERAHFDVEVRVQWVGSLLACRQIQQGDHAADVLIVADAELVRTMLPAALIASHEVLQTDALVLAYPSQGRMARALGSGKAWQVALAGLRVGFANPATAPLGYRTMMALALNDRSALEALRLGGRIRAALRREDERADAAQVMALVETGAVDAAFLYREEARAHGLAVQELDPAINFGDAARADWYASENLLLPDGKTRVKGSAVQYSIAALSGASDPTLAQVFAAFVVTSMRH